jgi:glycosyltransferase involved in cell wall biosynthesis
MKILMITPEPFFEPRGTPISVYQRLEALSSLGHEIDLLTYHVGKDVDFKNVRIHRTPQFNYIKRVEIGPSWGKLFLDGLLILKSLRMLLENKYDIIHSHEEASFFSAFLAPIFRTQHLYDMHSVLSRQLKAFNFANWWLPVKIFELLERWVIRTCDAIITVGCDLEEYVYEVNPSADQITIDNIALHEYETPADPQRLEELRRTWDLNNGIPVVYTGTFERYQGLDLLIESIKIVRERDPRVSFILVGAKPAQVKIWREKVRKEKVDDCTTIVEMVPPEEATIFLAHAKILISPRLDGTTVPLKIYSYLHSGKPIVATDISAHRQILDEDIAFLVQPTSDALADGIIRLVQNPELGQKISQQAKRMASERYSYQDYQKKVEWIYSTLSPDPIALVNEG